MAAEASPLATRVLGSLWAERSHPTHYTGEGARNPSPEAVCIQSGEDCLTSELKTSPSSEVSRCALHPSRGPGRYGQSPMALPCCLTSLFRLAFQPATTQGPEWAHEPRPPPSCITVPEVDWLFRGWQRVLLRPPRRDSAPAHQTRSAPAAPLGTWGDLRGKEARPDGVGQWARQVCKQQALAWGTLAGGKTQLPFSRGSHFPLPARQQPASLPMGSPAPALLPSQRLGACRQLPEPWASLQENLDPEIQGGILKVPGSQLCRI